MQAIPSDTDGRVHRAPGHTPFRPVRRRLAFLLLCLVLAMLLLALLLRVLAPGGWTGWEVLVLLAYLGTLPWTTLGAGNALVGLCRLLGGWRPALPAPARAGEAVAIALCLREEDMAAVLPPLGALLDGLEAAGAGHRFTLWFLSDTDSPGPAAAEERAIAGFARARRAAPVPPGGWVAVRHRRRDAPTGFKAGNVMDFLDRHAGEAGFLLCLDADSAMDAPAVLRLLGVMEAEPGLAILQPLIVGRPARAAFPRLYQFGMRAGMRAWGTGQDWWQGDEGPYWGHNALIRIAPFRAHARLERLPNGEAILSHDQVEAVRLHAAGWGVRLLPVEAGSLEGSPPAMPEFLARDRRWGAGNMQYFHLLRLPGLTAMGRWQLVQAILLFASAPLWALILFAAVGNAVSGGGAATPAGALAALMAATWTAYTAPKLAGYAEVLARPALAARYGGRAAFARGAAAELLFFALFEPVAVLNKALSLLLGPLDRPALPPALRSLLAPFRSRGWAAQNRAARGVAWADAARGLWPHALVAALSLGALATVSWGALAFGLAPLAGPLLAVPLCVWTASPRLSAALERRGIAATPEELEAGPPDRRGG